MSTSPTAPDADRWGQIQELFDRVVDLTEPERDAVLEASDAELAAEVRTLLAADREATGGFLDPLLRDDPSVVAAPSIERIGPYALREPLGAGGMGIVYRADRVDGQFDDQVAVKLLPRSSYASVAHQRFLGERQILAALRHENIACLFDGGMTADERPYLVLELVDGESIDAYCQRHALGVEARIELVLQVSAAVEHAHRRLVVHRDLKPSNVMVTRSGVVKLLDFGIAKLVEADPGLTATGRQMLSPRYASPEQIAGLEVTTASDIYQLGLLLYLLLTDRWPYRASFESSSYAVARAILEDDPVPPSRADANPLHPTAEAALEPAVDESDAARGGLRKPTAEGMPIGQLSALQRGDLDAILLRALRKEPERRYGSASELADDLRRYLAGEPVEARDEGRLYRLTKWVRRHRAAAAAILLSALLVVAVLVFSLMTMGQARRLEAESLRVEREASKAARVAEFLGEVLTEADPVEGSGEALSASRLLSDARQRITALPDDEVKSRLAFVVGRAYMNLGDFAAAAELAAERESVERARLESGAAEDVVALYEAMTERAEMLRLRGLLDDSVELYARSDALLAGSGVSPVHLARSLYGLAQVRRDQARHAEAEELLRRAVALWREGDQRAEVAEAVHVLGEVVHLLGRLEEAVELSEEAVRRSDALYGEASAWSVDGRHNLGMILSEKGEHERATELLERALTGTEAIYGGDHPNTAAVLGNFGVVLYRAGELDRAVEVTRRSLDIRRRVFPPDHPEVANGLHNVGTLELRSGRPGEAIELLRQALALRRAALGAAHPSTQGTEGRLAEALAAAEIGGGAAGR